MIECHGVGKRFGDFVALDDVSIAVRSGIYALPGPNGAGKSTLLKILTGLLTPDSGTARVCGLDIARQSTEVRRLIGVLPEDLGLFDSLTVEEHLKLCGAV